MINKCPSTTNYWIICNKGILTGVGQGGGISKGRNHHDKKLRQKKYRENNVTSLAATLNMSLSSSPLTNMVVIYEEDFFFFQTWLVFFHTSTTIYGAR